MIIERALEIVSEASRHLPAELKARHDQPWAAIANIGNHLRHAYHDTREDILRDVLALHLAPLEQVLKTELAGLEHP